MTGTRDRRRLRARPLAAAALTVGLAALAVATEARAQVTPGTNVNMVSGASFPDGDPFLQRQNEPSLAASTRNPLHLLAGANDYRTVDLPGPLDPLRGERMNADAWLGLYKSFDGGRTWKSSLLPGFPQDVTPEGVASPIKGRQAGTDPVVRAGTNGLFYYAGLAFDRGQLAPSAIFVARFIDRNDREEGDSIAYLGTRIVDQDGGARFLDKTALAVDIPRGGATCTIQAPLEDGTTVAQTIPAGPIYIAYSAFRGSGVTERSRIMFSRSTDCGATWSGPLDLSGEALFQNAQIAVNPVTGAVHVSWRFFGSGTKPSGILIATSTDGGVTFSKPRKIAAIHAFDQGTTDTSFRTNAFQAMAADADGRLYLAWPERGFARLRPDRTTGDARIVVTTSMDGVTWTPRRAIDTEGLGHHLMPSLTFHGGKLRLLYYTLQEDVSQVFGPYVDEAPILAAPDPKPPRHTIDVYVGQALPGPAPVFTIRRVSDYAFGTIDGSTEPERLQYNPPNLPLFRQGTVPFLGDYIDLAPAPAFIQGADGTWTYNHALDSSAVSHAAWADNRDVRAPADGNWQNYTPVGSDAVGSQSLFDPTLPVPTCVVGQTGMRNQNVYTAKVSDGLFVASPGNAKPLGSIERGFVVLVENQSAYVRSYRLSIVAQPPDGEASFEQFASSGSGPTSIDASVPPLSTIARTVYVTSADPQARVEVSVVEITAPGGSPLPAGLSGSVVLNGDLTNPRIQNPRIQNPRIQNPDIQVAEAYNPAFTTAILAPRIQNPRIQNPVIQDPSLQDSTLQAPRLQNDAIANPGIIDASTQAPRIQNISLQDSSIQNPRIQNESLVSGAIQDTTWVVTNDGNTTASYAIKLVLAGAVPDGIETQLVLHKTYLTPGADDCTLALQPRTVLFASIPDPDFITVDEVTDPSAQNPRIQNATLSLAPGESASVTLRVTDPNAYDGVTFDAGASVVPAAVAHAVNTEDAALGITTPRVALPLTITSPTLAATAPGAFYSFTLQAFGATGATTWTVVEGALPPGLTLNPLTGTISGTPTTPGNYVFSVQSVDESGNIDTQTLSLRVDPPAPSGYSRVWNGADADWRNEANWSPAGVPTAADTVYIAASVLVMPRLTSDVTVSALLVDTGATLDTNGFTLTVTGDVDGGNTIIGSGTVIAAGAGASIRGAFPNLTIAGSARLAGSTTVNGRLSLASGARLDLNGATAVASGRLVTDAATGLAPVIVGAGAALTVGGLDVNGLTLDRVRFTSDSGLLVRFDNVRFLNYAPEDAQLTIGHPGPAVPFSMTGLAFFVAPTTGSYITASDTADDSQALVLNVSAALPADGSSRTLTSGGAVVNWLYDPDAASLGVAQSVAPSPAVAGSPVTYTVVVANGGPAPATGVVLIDTLPASAAFVSATPGQGSCGLATGTVSCALGTIPANATVVVVIVVVPSSLGSIVNSVSVTANESDPATGDNSDVASTPVVVGAAAADLSVTKTDSADPVATGAPFSYTLTVHNSGPAEATSVVATDTLPDGVTATAVVTTQGTCGIAGQVVSCALGSLAASAQAIVTVSVTATGSGLVTNTASVAAAEADVNPADNAVGESTMIALGGCGGASFSGPTFLQTSAYVTETLSGRLDGDLHTDLVATVPDSNAVAVFLGDGAGGFGPPSELPAGTGPVEGVLTDLNGDTRPDLALEGLADAYVLMGNGAGGFGAPAAFSFAPGIVIDVRSGDFNHDGAHDLAVVHDGPNQLSLLLNDGAGGFTPGPSVALDDVPARLAVGDFTGDGWDDVAISFAAATGQPAIADYVWVLPQAAGGLGTPLVVTLPTTTPRSWVSGVGDLNADGHADLALAQITETPRRIYLLFGDGTGQFTPLLLSNAAADAFSVVSGDVNGDGFPDLVSAGGNTVGVQLGNGAGGFSPPTLLVSPGTGRLRVPLVSDVTGDGKADIVVASGASGVALYTNACGGAPMDVAVSVTDAADPVGEGEALTYSVEAVNAGAATADNVRVTAALPANATLTAIDAGGATCATDSGTSTCDLGTLAPGADVTLQFTFTTAAGGTVTFTAGVTADGADTNPADNTDVESTTIAATGQDFLVTSTSDAGPGSLRQAILDSNADTGDVDRILFDIAGGSPHTIVPLTALPTIATPVVIDATTQTGYAGTPVVELNGNGGAFNGLTITGGGSTIRGLAINRFGGFGINITTNGGNVVEGCFVGTDATGTSAGPNLSGIVVFNSAGNRVGGTTAGSRNVVSGNTNNGIALSGAGATGNLVVGNLVGTTVQGTGALPNGVGVTVMAGASDNVIGGTTAAERNVISGNTREGVFVLDAGTNGNRVSGNFIGLNAAGTAVVGNGMDGVLVFNGATNTTIGGTASGAGNVISGNRFGMSVAGSNTTGTIVQGNLIGTSPDGTIAPATFGNLNHAINLWSANTQTTIGGAAPGEGNLIAGNVSGILILEGSHGNLVLGNQVLQNRDNGIYINASPNNVIGGVVAGAGNLISGHTFNGIGIENAASTGNVIQGNRIGTTAAGTAALGNGTGVFINNAPGNIVGGTVAGAGNLVSGNSGSGVTVMNAGASGNVIQGNLVGTDPTGTLAVPNQAIQSGIFVFNAPNNLIGGPAAGAGNLVSGNAHHAITVVGSPSVGNVIQSNRVGVNYAGTAALANTGIGVDIVEAVNTTIRDNLISGNGLGIQIRTNAHGNIVEGNLIGSNADGTAAIGNGSGIRIQDAQDNRVGGPSAGARNLISGNSGNGVYIVGATSAGNAVQGNYIGVDVAAAAPLPNGGAGVTIDSASTTHVGGSGAGEGNVLAGNGNAGLLVYAATGTTAADTLVEGNFIGTNASLAPGLGNTLDGVAIVGDHGLVEGTTIGGSAPGSGNVIAGNGAVGVTVRMAGATRTRIEGNSIFDNASLGIDLSPVFDPDGVTANDAGDPDTGGNGLQNFPVVTSATGSAGVTTVAGTLNSTPAGNFRIEFFSSGACDPSGNGEGRTFIGSVDVVTDGSGNAPFSALLPEAEAVTATATDADGNTSEFSACVTATTGPSQISLSLVGTPLVGIGRQATLQVTLSAAAPAGGAVVSVSSDNPGVLTVEPPATVLVPESTTTAQVTLNGIASGTTTVRANAEGYLEGTLVVTVTPNVLTVPATLNVPFSQTTTLPVNIPQSAPAGGVAVSLVSADPGVIEVVTPTVTIPEGALSVNGTVRGVNLGTAAVTATNPSFSTAVSQVSSTGALNILETAASVRPSFPTSITVRLESGGNAVAAPAPGVVVTLTSADPACLAVPATVTIPTGLVSATVPLAFGGGALLPCGTTLGVTSGDLTADAIGVIVNPDPVLSLQGLPVTVGAGLQTNYNPACCSLVAILGEAQHGGVTLHIESSDPSKVVVSPNSTTVGTGALDVAVPNGTSYAYYYVQGVEGAAGTATLTFSAPGFGEVIGEVTVAQSAVQIASLPSSVTVAGANVDFYVMIGLPDTLGAAVAAVMPVRAGHTVTATVANDNPAAAQLLTLAGAGQSRSVDIAAGSYYSNYGVVYGGIAFDPVAEGTTTVSATVPGFLATAAASVGVTVVPAGITMQGLPVTVGAGLQTNYNPTCCILAAILSGSAHGGVTLHLESSNPSVAVLSGDATTPGAGSIDVFVPDGQYYVGYYVHGLEGASGDVTITASAPGFGTASGSVTIVPAAFQLVNLPTSAAGAGNAIDFQVRLGVADPTNSYVGWAMAVRAGQSVTATVTNSNAAAAQLETLAGGTGQSLPVTIPAGSYDSPYGLASGGIAFDPTGTGTTTVTATIPGFTATTAATRDVTVGTPAITVQGLPVSVGAGLETSSNPACCGLAGWLSGGDHGGVTVHVESSNAAVALVSADLVTEGAASFDYFVPDGQTYVPLVVHGVEGTTGSSTITFSTPGFESASGTVTVAQPAVQIYYLPTATTSLSADIDFVVAVGLPSGDNAYVATPMPARAGHPLTATVVSSNGAVAQLQTVAGGAGQSLPVIIPAGSYTSAYGVASGGIAFDPIGGGTTQVSASIPGFVQTAGAIVDVTVGTASIALYGLPVSVGAGLQTNYNPACCALAAVLAATEHGGVTVRIESSNPGVVLVSPDATTPGTAVIDVFLANGQSSAYYYVQGVEGASGTVTLTASAPGFSQASGTVTVVQPAVQIYYLPTATTPLSADSEFVVAVGLPSGDNTVVATPMAARAGHPLTATVVSSNGAVGQLRTAFGGTGQSLPVTIYAGSYTSPYGVASGGIAFDPIGVGTTQVSASVPGFIQTAGATVPVTVAAASITLDGLPISVGAGLQNNYNLSCCLLAAVLGATDHGGVTVRIESSNPGVVLVSPNATTPGTAFIDVVVANGQNSAYYYVQGVDGASGTVTLTASAPGFSETTGTVTVVAPALQVVSLPTSTTAGAANTAFRVYVGLADASSSYLTQALVVRPGSSLEVTLTNSNASVAQLVTQAGAGQIRTVSIPAGSDATPNGVASGGIAFDPIANGTTTVTAGGTGLNTTAAAVVTVVVSP